MLIIKWKFFKNRFDFRIDQIFLEIYVLWKYVLWLGCCLPSFSLPNNGAYVMFMFWAMLVAKNKWLCDCACFFYVKSVLMLDFILIKMQKWSNIPKAFSADELYIYMQMCTCCTWTNDKRREKRKSNTHSSPLFSELVNQAICYVYCYNFD